MPRVLSHGTGRASAEAPVTRIQAGRKLPDRPLRAVWRSRELVYLLARRDVLLRYQHSLVSIGWAILQPLLTLFVLTIFQALIGRRSPSTVPYPLYAVTGLVPWTFLTHSMTVSSSSVLKHFGIINKVYFPRLVLPLAAVLAGAVDFLAALPLIPVLLFYYGISPGLPILLFPVFVLQVVALAIAVGLWLAALNARFRDTANALPFVTQVWFFLTPIAYFADMIPARWRIIAGLNPMLGILEGFRWSLFGQAAPASLGLWVATSWALVIILLVSGTLVFLAGEETLTDIL